jgi:hypothetical protein
MRMLVHKGHTAILINLISDRKVEMFF